MADIPSNVSYGTVTGRFLLAYADTNDSGLAPDAIPAQGSIFFTPSVTVLKNIDASPAPVTILPATVQASLDDNGYLRSFTGTSGTGIRLIASDDDSNNPFNWSWRAEFRLTDQNGAPVAVPPFNFSLPSNSTIDLTEVSPVTESDGLTYITGPRGLPGKGLRIDGSVADASFLPEGTEADQSYVTEDTGHLWIWNTEDWIDVGPFEGTPGEGVPTGGVANSFLSKIDGDDYNTFWSTTIDGGSAEAIQTLVKVRRDSAFNWETENPPLEAGEIGFEVDTNRLKIGNGYDLWGDLQYTSGGASVEISETEPSEVSEGSVWFSSTDGRAYIYYDSVWVDLNPGIQGPKGEDSTIEGPQGEPGIDGVGVPAGGATGDVLAKVDSDDYNTTWIPQQFRVFEDAAARTSAIDTPTDGMLTYLQDVNTYETYSDSSFVPLVKQGLTLIKSENIGTAVTTVTLNDVFSSNYDAYRVVISGGVSSANVILQMQLGTANTGYYTASNQATFAAVGSTPGQVNTAFANVGIASSLGISLVMDIVNPFTTRPTYFNGQTVLLTTTGYVKNFGGFHNSTTLSFTSLRIFPASGTLTGGTIRVYGYRKEV